jgi:hypothetical protein
MAYPTYSTLPPYTCAYEYTLTLPDEASQHLHEEDVRGGLANEREGDVLAHYAIGEGTDADGTPTGTLTYVGILLTLESDAEVLLADLTANVSTRLLPFVDGDDVLLLTEDDVTLTVRRIPGFSVGAPDPR